MQRVLKFVKYFPEFGIHPSVLTVQNGDYPAMDDTLGAEVPESVPVYRVEGWEPYKLYRKFTGMKATESIPVGVLSGDNGQSSRTRIANWVRLNLFVPDARRFLVRPFVNKARKVIDEDKIDAILTSSPPHSMQLVGLKLKKEMDIPWIGDFRDPWIDIDYYKKVGRTRFAVRRDYESEKDVVNSLDSLVAVNQSIIDEFQSRYKPKRTAVIYNGFDEEDFFGIPRNQERTEGKFTIVYYGNLGSDRIVPEFVEAVRLCIEQNPDCGERLKIRFIGNVDERMKQLFASSSLLGNVDFVDYMPHGDLIREVASASLLLLIINRVPNNSGNLPGKLFEYLAFGTPILGLGPAEGEASEIIKKTGSGEMVNYTDTHGMARFIERLILSEPHGFKRSSDQLIPFTRRHLAQRLADIIRSTVGETQ